MRVKLSSNKLSNSKLSNIKVSSIKLSSAKLSSAKLLSVMVLSGISMQAVANEYWVGRDGEYVRDRNGHCVRTIKWTDEAAISGCEGGELKTAGEKSAADAAKDAAAESTAKLAAETTAAAAVSVVAAVPAQAQFSLASGASFEHGGSVLSSEGKAEIAALVGQFEGKTVDAVVIEGYSDSSGAAAFNQQLSEERAEAVKAELVANGANAEKISTVGYGEANPIADNNTREGRAENRRVEIKVDGIKESQI